MTSQRVARRRAVNGTRISTRMQWVSDRRYSRGASYRIGRGAVDAAPFRESIRSGYHVYIYADKDGRILYVGKSGGVGGHRDWVTRLQEMHMETEWIKMAKSVTVYYDLDNRQMWALEEVLIGRNPDGSTRYGHARYNQKPGEYTQKFGALELACDAAAAMKGRVARFTFAARTPF